MKPLIRGTILAVLGIILMLGTGGNASAVDCTSLTTLAGLVGTGATGCTIQDKTFSSFTTTLSAADQTATITSVIFHALGSGLEAHGWTFDKMGGFTSNFSLAYTISVAPGNPTVFIAASVDQIFDGTFPFDVSVVDTQTPGVLNVSGASTATATAQLLYSPLSSVHTSSVVTIGAGAQLASYEQAWIEIGVPQVPEPGTLLLLGTGLVGLGGFIWRRNRNS